MFLLLALACTTEPLPRTDDGVDPAAEDTASEDTASEDTASADTAGEPDAPSFTEALYVLEAGCGTCHTSAYIGRFLEDGDAAASYALLLNADPHSAPTLRYVVPGDPDASLIIRRLVDDPELGEAMPPEDTYAIALTEDQIALLRRWIAAGAEGP